MAKSQFKLLQAHEVFHEVETLRNSMAFCQSMARVAGEKAKDWESKYSVLDYAIRTAYAEWIMTGDQERLNQEIVSLFNTAAELRNDKNHKG